MFDEFTGTYGINPKYKEILKLSRMLTEADVPHVLCRMFDGWQVCYPSKYSDGECVMDAIEHHGSYGNSEDRLEIMGLLTPEEAEHDSVLGHLTAEEVFERIQRHYSLNSRSEEKAAEPKVIAVDFDGTLCENKWPDIGEPNLELIERMKADRKKGHKIILWTCREGMKLVDAIVWCSDHGLFFDAINDNIEGHISRFGGNSRKVFADVYIDDKALRPGDNIYILKGEKNGTL